jgi:pSer/pThr/pTyr-binding forkhead associated (FHA) protein
LDEARDALVSEGDYLAFDDDERVHVMPLQDGWTRVGRSLSAHVRFDDPTVSRRHALVYRDGERVELSPLADGDEIAIGRFRLYFVQCAGDSVGSGDRFSRAVG